MRPLQGGAAFIRCDFAKKTNQDAPEHFIAFSVALAENFSENLGIAINSMPPVSFILPSQRFLHPLVYLPPPHQNILLPPV